MQELQFEKAIAALQALISRGHPLLEEQARWYLALCYLYTNDLTASRKLLYTIVQDSTYQNIDNQLLINALE